MLSRSHRLLGFTPLLLLLMAWTSFDINTSGAFANTLKGRAVKGKAVAAKKAVKYPPEFVAAVRQVFGKEYKKAFDTFDRLDKNGYCTDKIHYYMALCLHNLNQTQAAAQHYQVVYNFSKDKQLKYLAAVGYGQVAKYANNRTYSGQGNLFAKVTDGPAAGNPWSGGSSGGGGAVCGPRG